MQFYTDLGFRVKKQKGKKFVSVGDLSESLSHAEAKLGKCVCMVLANVIESMLVCARSLPCCGQESCATVGSVAMCALSVPDAPLSHCVLHPLISLAHLPVARCELSGVHSSE